MPNHLEDWPSKQQAAVLLGVSEKTIDRMAIRGQIQKGLWKRPGLPPIVVFHPGDLERAKEERERLYPVPSNRSTELQVMSGAQTEPALIRTLNAIADRVAAAVPPPEPLQEPHLLSLKQAREVSGAPLTSIRKLAVKIDGRWRVNRLDLERFAREHRQTSEVSDQQLVAARVGDLTVTVR